MKVTRRIVVSINLADNEKFFCQTRPISGSGRIFDFMADHVSGSEDLKYGVTVSGRAINKDGSIGLIDRSTYMPFDSLPTEVASAYLEALNAPISSS